MNGGFRVAAPDEVIAAAAQRAADTASAVDQHDAPTLAETLAGYGSLGALGLGVERDGHDVTDAVALLSAVAAECMSTAFSLWAHRMVTEYVRASSLPDRDELLGELVTGRLAGSIAMATALQESAGLGTVPTVAETDGVGGYRVSGRIAWASNIAPGTLVILPARVGEGRVLLAVRVGAEGLTTHPVEGLLALDATRSAMLVLDL